MAPARRPSPPRPPTAGAIGFLAAGYLTPDALSGQIDAVATNGVPFGVNIFVPSGSVADRAAVQHYREALSPLASRFDVEPGPIIDVDDLIAAGGIGDAAGVAAALRAGAAAVQVGTALLDSDEAGTKPAHRSALRSTEFTETVVTRAFTGRPARVGHGVSVGASCAGGPDHPGPVGPGVRSVTRSGRHRIKSHTGSGRLPGQVTAGSGRLPVRPVASRR